jgi:putative glutamine amidotransferase
MSAANGKGKSGARPTIGVTLDSEEPGGYSKFPWYAVRQNYADAVVRAGGLPLFLPHEPDQVEDYLGLIDGLVVTGGAFDIDPALFGAAEKHPTVKLKGRRTEFEWKITKTAVERDLPVLGICGGQQLLNVVLGGTLIQHIPDEVKGPLAHEQPNPRNEPGHSVTVEKNTLLYRICGVTSLEVNSAHHQAAKSVGPGITINAKAEDGVIEGIEDPRHRFVLGVQWHPEFAIDPGDRKIFAALIDAAS